MPSKTFFVYILTNHTGTLYIGMTNNLPRRLWEHKSGEFLGFSAKFKTNKLIHFEAFADPLFAIAREKELKGWVRKKKVELVRKSNPKFEDLSQNLENHYLS